MDQQQKHWWQSVDITSEEEYNQATSKLAAELMGEHTPEEIAGIAATHMIYVNALESLIAELRETSELRKELIAEKDNWPSATPCKPAMARWIGCQ